MLKLTITIEKDVQPNTHLAHFDGAFDGSVNEPLSDLENLISSSPAKTRLIFDFSSLSYLNSYAIGQLVAWHNHLVKQEGQILIAAPTKNVEDILNILGISSLFKVFPDVEAAKQSL